MNSVLKSFAKGRLVLVTSQASGAPRRMEKSDVKRPSLRLLKRAV
jgi:hypothetical protein